jgi:hypothetical protein
VNCYICGANVTYDDQDERAPGPAHETCYDTYLEEEHNLDHHEDTVDLNCASCVTES